MPFQSKAQSRFLWAKHPEVAREFAAKTPSYRSLPEKKAAPKSKKKYYGEK